MSTLDLDALLDAAVAAAHTGGAIIRDAFGAARHVVAKAPGDWVSETDMASERAVRTALLEAAPDIPVVGEEEGGDRTELGWLVDPLDGTANFLHRFPVVALSVALVEDGVPVVGVVDAPLLGETYTARRSGGAWRGEERLAVSDRAAEEAIVATGFPFRKKRERLDEYLPVFERALRGFEDLRRAGAAALDLAWCAAGTFDGYFEQALGPWDVAAGALLVREAGGIVTDWHGDDRAWLDSGDIVAGPTHVHERLLELIAAR
ncbi:MAG TPA: inositol monophosphatase family protein [Acidimicrobiia bacterium]